jgi:hypothetical protein
MQATLLNRVLQEYDKGLRVRWANPVGLFCVERKHGYAGLGTDAVLRMLYDKWKRLESESGGVPTDDERRAYDEYDSRRQGYQPILYLRPSEANYPDAILYILLDMDIRKAGGPEAWARQHKDAQEKAAKVLRAQRRERLRGLAEQAYDRVAVKKDFHAQGSDAFFYPHDRIG